MKENDLQRLKNRTIKMKKTCDPNYYIVKTPIGQFKRMIELDPRMDNKSYTVMGKIVKVERPISTLENGERYSVSANGSAKKLN